MNRVLVTGAAGFIGTHLCELLLREDYEIIAIDNLITGRRENILPFLDNKRFQFLENDATKPLPLAELTGLNYVLHMASPASPIAYGAWPIETMMTNSLGTYALLELARAHNARFIMASTSEVYGDPLEHPQREGYWGNVNPIGPRSCYDESKRFAEALTMSYQRQYDLSIGIMRIFNTYGPKMQASDGRVITNFIDQALNGEPMTIYGDGKQTRSFCYVSDLVRGILLLVKSDVSGPVNLGNNGEYTILEIAEKIRELTGTSSSFSFCPLPTDDPTRRRPDISLAKSLLNWEPELSLEQGLSETIAYFRSLK